MTWSRGRARRASGEGRARRGEPARSAESRPRSARLLKWLAFALEAMDVFPPALLHDGNNVISWQQGQVSAAKDQVTKQLLWVLVEILIFVETLW